MKILLASLSVELESRGEHSPGEAYPLGLAYLFSTLEKEGHSVELLFLNNYDEQYSEKAFFECVEKFQPDVVGFQIFTMNRTSTFFAIEELHRKYPAAKIVIGGIHASVMYEQILNRFQYAIAIIGEGEITFVELLEKIENPDSYGDIDGIAFFNGNDVTRTKQRSLINDLDALPDAKHEVFFESEPKRTVGHIITSRGCPFDCSFCCLKAISLRKYRERDINKVVDEIVDLKQKYPRLNQIQFHDDTFLLNNKRVIEFCRSIIPRKLKIKFVCSARVKPISSEMFSWMEKAGFVKIMFGLETGSTKLLESIHKKITEEDVLNLFNTLKKHNFIVTTFLMCGFPGETDETIQETIDLVKKTQKIYYNYIAGIGKLWVYPGTEVYQIMKEKGKIADEYWMTTKPVPYFTVEHDLNKLISFEEKLMDHLSVTRIWTANGFKNHFLKMPWSIIRFLRKKKRARI